MKLVKSCIIFSLKKILSNRWLGMVLFLGIVLGTYFKDPENTALAIDTLTQLSAMSTT